MTVERDNLLPPTATAFEDAQSQTSARLLDAPVQVVRAARKGATAPRQLLGHLGWERSIHHPSADEETQRARIDSSFADHLSYGSPAALEGEIALDAGAPVRVVEFWEDPSLEWPDFIVEIELQPGDAAPDMAAIARSALLRKNVRDWPSKARVRVALDATPFHVGSASFVGAKLRVAPENYKPAPSFTVGSALFLVPTIRVLPL